MVAPARERFPLLTKPEFYNFEKAPFPVARAGEVYADLAKTDFPSLYGAMNLYDDFAETFVIYIHTRLLKKPYRVEVLRDGQWATAYHSCLTEATCDGKARYVAAMLGE